MPDHTIATTTKFLEEEIICRYGIPKFIFINNDGEWFVEFHNLCKVYGIHHQYIALYWFWCNGMAEILVKTIKHDISIMSTFQDNSSIGYLQLLKVLFGYRCGI
jgi:hypothetical protein